MKRSFIKFCRCFSSFLTNVIYFVIFGQLDPSKVTRNHLEALRVMVDRDQLHQLHEQEKELIWNLRYECREHFPYSLPKLLSCVSWNNYVEVALV